MPSIYTDCGEGPWTTEDEAIGFAEAEVGVPWVISKNGNGFYIVMTAEESKRFDVHASCHEINGDGSDGAYDLVMDAETAEEIGKKLTEVLNAGFGLSNTSAKCRLEIHIAEAGQGDNLPL